MSKSPELDLFNNDSENTDINLKFNEKGRVEVNENDIIDNRYRVIEKLGKGTYGDVFECYDQIKSKFIALKISRKEKRFYYPAMKEINIFKKFENEENYNDNIIKLNRYFNIGYSMIYDFEIFGKSLYKYYEDKNNIINVKDISYQLLNGLIFIHKLKIIHADLKPENILICNSKVKIIDFGSSIYEKDNLYEDYIQSRWYRSPEVVFKQLITTKIDIWSLGCIIYEIYYRKPLFPARNEKNLIDLFNEKFGSKDTYKNNSNYLQSLIFDNLLKKKKNIYVSDNSKLDKVIDHCICLDYKKRSSAKDLIKLNYFS